VYVVTIYRSGVSIAPGSVTYGDANSLNAAVSGSSGSYLPPGLQLVGGGGGGGSGGGANLTVNVYKRDGDGDGDDGYDEWE